MTTDQIRRFHQSLAPHVKARRSAEIIDICVKRLTAAEDLASSARNLLRMLERSGIDQSDYIDLGNALLEWDKANA
jgi:hypothetical protein